MRASGAAKRYLALLAIVATGTLSGACGAASGGTSPYAVPASSLRRILMMAKITHIRIEKGGGILAIQAAGLLKQSSLRVQYAAFGQPDNSTYSGELVILAVDSHANAAKLKRLWHQKVTYGGAPAAMNTNYAFGPLVVSAVGFDSAGAHALRRDIVTIRREVAQFRLSPRVRANRMACGRATHLVLAGLFQHKVDRHRLQALRPRGAARAGDAESAAAAGGLRGNE